jgi:hypothetical protein
MRQAFEWVQTPLRYDFTDLREKKPKVGDYRGGPRQWRSVWTAMFRQPVPHASDCPFGIVPVHRDILAADVRQGGIISVGLRFQDQGAFAAVPAFSKESAPR